jgi:hypothetical protein
MIDYKKAEVTSPLEEYRRLLVAERGFHFFRGAWADMPASIEDVFGDDPEYQEWLEDYDPKEYADLMKWRD